MVGQHQIVKNIVITDVDLLHLNRIEGLGEDLRDLGLNRLRYFRVLEKEELAED